MIWIWICAGVVLILIILCVLYYFNQRTIPDVEVKDFSSFTFSGRNWEVLSRLRDFRRKGTARVLVFGPGTTQPSIY